MKQSQARLGAFIVAAIFVFGTSALAQEPAPPVAQTAAPATKTFSQQELEQLIAPIALYPDALLAQILMAATYPLEVIQAARWVEANPKVTGKALEDAMAKQSWDPSVKGLTSVPQVLKQMNDNLEWMQKLGDAFLAQKEDVMATAQALRGKAAANGNLKSTPEQVVKTEVVESKTVYVIESPKPEVVYVPTYDPAAVYGTWAYPAYPPYYMYPPGYAYAPGLTFAAGMFVGAAIWGGCGWGHNDVYINHNNYNNFNRTNIQNNQNWNHNSQHRQGVPYRDQNTASKYNRGGGGQAQSRDAYRGREQGGGGFDGGRGGGPSASTREAGGGTRGGGPSASTRDVGGGASSRGGGGRSDGGFGGMSSGSSTRAASSRGSSSYGGSRSGGGGRGGGGRRR